MGYRNPGRRCSPSSRAPGPSSFRRVGELQTSTDWSPELIIQAICVPLAKKSLRRSSISERVLLGERISTARKSIDRGNGCQTPGRDKDVGSTTLQAMRSNGAVPRRARLPRFTAGIRVQHEVHSRTGLTRSSGIRGGCQSVVPRMESYHAINFRIFVWRSNSPILQVDRNPEILRMVTGTGHSAARRGLPAQVRSWLRPSAPRAEARTDHDAPALSTWCSYTRCPPFPVRP
jgi:hypothetical protein